MRIVLICLMIVSNLGCYQYTIYNKTKQPVRVILDFSINKEVRDIEPGGTKRLEGGLRCLNSISAHALTAPVSQDVWHINCNPWHGGINCCADFIITINPGTYRPTVQLSSQGRSIGRNRFTESYTTGI